MLSANGEAPQHGLAYVAEASSSKRLAWLYEQTFHSRARAAEPAAGALRPHANLRYNAHACAA